MSLKHIIFFGAFTSFVSGCSHYGPGHTHVKNLEQQSPQFLSRNYCQITSDHLMLSDDGILSDLSVDQSSSIALSPNQLEAISWQWIQHAKQWKLDRYFEMAADAARCIDEKQPGSLNSILLIAHLKMQNHDFSGAEELAQTLTARRGIWFDHATLGDAQMEQGKYQEAAFNYQKMVDARPGPQAFSRIAEYQWITGDRSGGLNMAIQAAYATSERDPVAKAWVDTRLAFFLYQSGNVKQARQLATRVTNQQSWHAPALFLLGKIEMADKNFREAGQFLAMAIDADPLPEYLWAYSESQQQLSNALESQAAEEKIILHGAKTDPRMLALYLAHRGIEMDRAELLILDEMQKRQDPTTVGISAFIQWKKGNLLKAQKLIKKAITTNPIDSRLRFHAALIARSAGNNKQAKQHGALAQKNYLDLMPSEQRQLQQLHHELTDRSI